jgi:hypothetical protein
MTAGYVDFFTVTRGRREKIIMHMYLGEICCEDVNWLQLI